MENIFYNSTLGFLTYDNLLQKLNNSQTIDTAYRAVDYSSFIVNVINAIINNIDITLLDYRNINDNKYQSESFTISNNISSINELIDLIKNSKSSLGVFSSGTEGKPKLIFQSIERLLKSVQIDDKYKNTKWAFTYNPSHSAGIQLFLQVICNRASLYDLYKTSRQSILDTIAVNQLTHLSATPTFYRMLAPYDFTCQSVISLTLNGEKSTQELINKVKLIFPNARIRNIYGSTESGPLMSSENATFIVPQRLLNKLKIEDNELFISSELISKSVGQNLSWYSTGDLVEIKNADPLTIEFISRKSRIINVGGHNVNPQEIEETLLSHHLIKDARVFEKSSSMIGSVVCAEVQILDNKLLTEKDIIDYCKQKLASYKLPRIIKFVTEIKAGNTGKKSI